MWRTYDIAELEAEPKFTNFIPKINHKAKNT